MKTPKERFLDLPQSKVFEDLATNPAFQLAVDYAFLQMVNDQPLQSAARGETDTSAAAANAFRLEGARRFISILTTLPLIIPQKKAAAYNDNLER